MCTAQEWDGACEDSGIGMVQCMRGQWDGAGQARTVGWCSTGDDRVIGQCRRGQGAMMVWYRRRECGGDVMGLGDRITERHHGRGNMWARRWT